MGGLFLCVCVLVFVCFDCLGFFTISDLDFLCPTFKCQIYHRMMLNWDLELKAVEQRRENTFKSFIQHMKYTVILYVHLDSHAVYEWLKLLLNTMCFETMWFSG